MLEDESYRAQWEALAGTSYGQMQQKLLSDLPEGTRLRTEYWGGGFFALNISNRPSGPESGFSFHYTVTPGETCKFDGANVYEQGANVAASVNASLLKILPDMGITTVYLTATDIGSYLWARAGFAPYQNEWERIALRIEARLNYLAGLSGSGLTLETAAEIRQHLHNADPKSLWHIAERDEKICGVKLGKALTLEWSETCFPGNNALTGQSPAQLRETISWHGACDLKDAECQNRFIAHASSGHSLSRERKGANIPAIKTF